MKLLVQPDAGAAPLISAVKSAKISVDIVIFRADLKDFQKALEAAVARGVLVHALIANTNRGGEKRLRKLEQSLLAAGVTVSRSNDDLIRYHDKIMIVDRKTLYVLGFNFTHLEVTKCRSLGLVTNDRRFVQEAMKLFEADTTRQPYTASLDSFVVSPLNARSSLAALVRGARKQLLIFDPKISDSWMIRLLHERAKAGVDVRVLGRVTSRGGGLRVAKHPKLRVHVRAILADGRQLFVGSQSLRSLELDGRREVGLIVNHPEVTKKVRAIFEADWALTDAASKEAAEQKNQSATEAPSKSEKTSDEKTSGESTGTAA